MEIIELLNIRRSQELCTLLGLNSDSGFSTSLEMTYAETNRNYKLTFQPKITVATATAYLKIHTSVKNTEVLMNGIITSINS